jgi:hypothetical protein
MMKMPAFFVALVICIGGFDAANLTPLLGPLLYTMTPLQRYYVADYLASTWHQDDPTATTETRLLWKSRKGKFELATEQDLVPLPLGEVIGRYSPQLFALSNEALAEGWTGISRGVSQKVNSAMLERLLEQDVYDRNKAWRFFLQPALGLVTLIVIGLFIRAWRRQRWERNMWNTRGKTQLSFWAWSVEASDRMAKRLLPRPKGPEIPSAPPMRQLELKAPAPKRILIASMASAETKPTPKSATVPSSVSTASTKKPAVVQAALPITPVASAKQKPAFVWDESQGLD